MIKGIFNTPKACTKILAFLNSKELARLSLCDRFLSSKCKFIL